jgi:hypothetical protein
MPWVTVEVEACVELHDFSDDAIREEYERRMQRKAPGTDPQLAWKHDAAELVLAFYGLDAGQVRESIELGYAYRLLDLCRASAVIDARVAA